MKILIISDIHYGEDTNYPLITGKDYINSFGSQFDKYVSKIKTIAREHDLIINLGDLIKENSIENDLIRYKKAINLFGEDTPSKHIIGNHDLWYLSRNQLSEIIKEDKIYYSFDLNNYHHIVLDSFRNSKEEQPEIDLEQKNWLQNDLKNTNLPTLVYCHYALDNQPLDNNPYFKDKPQKVFIKNKEEIRKIFEDSKIVVAVFGGHLHFSHQENINGIKYITAPAFSENNGNNTPNAECLSANLDGREINLLTIKIN